MSKRNWVQLAGFAGIVGLAIGCSGSGDSGVPVPADQTVTDNPTAVMPWSDIVKKTDVPAKIRVNDHGTAVVEKPMTIVSAYSEAGDNILVLTPAAGDVNGPGDSGSTLLVGGKVVGALFAGDDPHHSYGRGIEQVMATGTASTKANKTGAWGPNQWYFSGPSQMLDQLRKKKGFENTLAAGAPTGAPAAFSAKPPFPPLPGRRYGAAVLTGPDAALYIIATYSIQLPNKQWVATGHPIDQTGPRSLPIYPIYMDGRDDDGTVIGHLFGSAYGTMTFDGRYGSIIDPMKVPKRMPIQLATTIDKKALPLVEHAGILENFSSEEFTAMEYGVIVPALNELSELHKQLNGSGSIRIYQGTTSTNVPLQFQGAEDPATFVNDLDLQLVQAIFTQHTADPSQIIRLEVLLDVTTQ